MCEHNHESYKTIKYSETSALARVIKDGHPSGVWRSHLRSAGSSASPWKRRSREANVARDESKRQMARGFAVERLHTSVTNPDERDSMKERKECLQWMSSRSDYFRVEEWRGEEDKWHHYNLWSLFKAPLDNWMINGSVCLRNYLKLCLDFMSNGTIVPKVRHILPLCHDPFVAF